MSAILSCIACAVTVGFAAAPSTQEFIVWNYGPQTGIATPAIGGYWGNRMGVQYFADNVELPTVSTISGFNLFTASDAMPPEGNSYRVTFYNDNSGAPGTIFAQHNITAQSIEYAGNFPAEYDTHKDVYQVNLRFTPVTVSANATFWVGATSIGYNIGQVGVIGPGDGLVAQWASDGSMTTTRNIGDTMFQLVAIPEPSRAALLIFGAALASSRAITRRRSF